MAARCSPRTARPWPAASWSSTCPTARRRKQFSDGDPYAKAGLFQSVAIHPTRKVFVNAAAAG